MIIKLFEDFNKKFIFNTYRGINHTDINSTYGGINDDGMGQFSTDNLTMAKWFAGLTEYNPNKDKYVKVKNNGEVIELTITVTNPYIIDMGVDVDDDSVQIYFNEIEKHGGVTGYRKFLMDQKYDSIILKNCTTNYYEDGKVYTVFIVL
jgi:hypothetical protein